MEVIPYAGPTQMLILGIQPGEMLLESIQEAIRSQGVKNGAVVSGIGTLKTCRMHYIVHAGLPPQDRKFFLEKPLELLSVSGLIADGEPHLHIVVSCGEDEVYGGHLEGDSEVLYLAEIAIVVFDELKLVRRASQEPKIRLLRKMEE